VPVAQVLHRSSLRAPGRPGRTLNVSQFDQTVVLAASMIGNSKEARRTLQTDPASSYKRGYKMETVLIVLVVLFLIGGGGWGYSRWRG
jgi:hypothetical protein